MYEELIKRLRVSCEDCKLWDGYRCCLKGDCTVQTRLQAADAIEEMQKLNCELLFRVGQAEALIDYYQTGGMISNEPPKEKT